MEFRHHVNLTSFRAGMLRLTRFVLEANIFVFNFAFRRSETHIRRSFLCSHRFRSFKIIVLKVDDVFEENP